MRYSILTVSTFHFLIGLSYKVNIFVGRPWAKLNTILQASSSVDDSHNYNKNLKSGIGMNFERLGKEFSFITRRTPKEKIAVFVCSDLHADSQKNQDWVRNNCLGIEDSNTFSVLILPGDIATEVSRLSTVFEVLTSNYDAVCYCIGNHEAWRRGTKAGGSPLRPEDRTAETDRTAKDSLGILLYSSPTFHLLTTIMHQNRKTGRGYPMCKELRCLRRSSSYYRCRKY